MTYIHKYHHNRHIDKLVSNAYELGLGMTVSKTIQTSRQSGSTFGHLIQHEAEKFNAKYGSLTKSDPLIAKALIFATFGVPYSNGIQFRGMLTAINDRENAVEVFKEFVYNEKIAASITGAYRMLARPPVVNQHGNLTTSIDCSLAINDPFLRPVMSGHYITQMANLLLKKEVKKARAENKNNVTLDDALIQFAKNCILYESTVDNQLLHHGESTRDLQIHVHKSIRDAFKLSVPLIAETAKNDGAKVMYDLIISQAQGKPSQAWYYHDALHYYAHGKPSDITPRTDVLLNTAA